MIENREALATSEAHSVALDCVTAAIDAANPETATRSAVSLDGETFAVGETVYDLEEYRKIVLVGGGKAAHGVATALESVLGERITDGIVVTKHEAETDAVRCVTGDHPLPSERNVAATDDLLRLLSEAGSETLVLFVVTGGASALLTSPAGDLSVGTVRETTELLLDGGVPVADINTVRKHLSNSKGGHAAREAAPATVATLLLSDVVGNDRSAIGSGPTVPDETTFSAALEVFDRYDLTPPASVQDHLEAGVAGRLDETPFTDDPVFTRTESHLLGDNGVALDAARTVAADAGYSPLVLSSRLRGESREVAKAILAVAEECVATGDPVEPPAVLLIGGESTVTTSGEPGNGGPNQEFVLEYSLGLSDRTVVAAVDTDGEDGSSGAAGAIGDQRTVTDADRAQRFLDANDAGTYLSEVGATIHTGPTGTNVNDVVAVVLPDPAE
ncbi:glycerate kinase type-2 family protein [Haloarcula sp. GH36]|uniref:glycerate kinase type-2 family protein n=1 Tax=Haloarcula montana TaxID=3111776 RepID=UPI002D774EA4|nr:DUF4147 domain-containing protein [Haloarcula sp. GH36]